MSNQQWHRLIGSCVVACAIGVGARAQVGVLINEPIPQQAEPPSADQGLFGPIPSPGRIDTLSRDLELDIWTAQLANGVLVHTRSMRTRPGWVEVSIVLRGGIIDETSRTRGLTDAAAVAFETPATAALDADAVAARLSGHVIETTGLARITGVELRLAGDRSDTLAAMQLAHALLTQPRLDASALGQWQALERASLRTHEHSLSTALNEAAVGALYPEDEVRVRPIGVDRIDSIKRDDAQDWLDRLVATAPIEVGIAGDLPTRDALELARVYLGSIPARPMTPALAPPAVTPKPLPTLVTQHTTGTDQTAPGALVLASWVVPGEVVRARHRQLRLAAGVIADRLSAPRADGDALEGSCRLLPDLELLDAGLFYLVIQTQPDRIDEARNAAHKLLKGIVSTPPTDAEIERVRSSIIDEVLTRSDQPRWWARRLGWWQAQGYPAESTDQIVRVYEAISPDEIPPIVRSIMHPQRVLDVAVSIERAGADDKPDDRP